MKAGFAGWRGNRFSRPDKPDIVHAHALPQAARFRQADIPVVVNLPGEPNLHDVADLRTADALIADGWAATQLPAKLGRPVTRVVKGIDAALFRPDGPSVRQPLRLTGRRVVVAVSRFVPIKNVRLLVDAIAIVRQRVPNVHLLVVGDGPEHRHVASRVAEHDLRDCVTLVGSVAHADTPAYYRAGDVFGLSSEFDNSPNAVLEAMACGLPIVATDSGGVRDFVEDSSSGAIVPTGDAPALADALERYLANPELARQAGDHNRRKASTEFSSARERASTSRGLSDDDRIAPPHDRDLDMKVALRDDDTSFFTAPASLEQVYAGIWDRVPVCLAVVPFAIGYRQPGIPREHWHSGESFPLEHNVELVNSCAS